SCRLRYHRIQVSSVSSAAGEAASAALSVLRSAGPGQERPLRRPDVDGPAPLLGCAILPARMRGRHRPRARPRIAASRPLGSRCRIRLSRVSRSGRRAAIDPDLEPLPRSDFRELGREAAPAVAFLQWRFQSGPYFRGEGDSDSPAGWKVRGRGARRNPDGARGPLPPSEGAVEPDEGAAVQVARRAARGPRGREAADVGGGLVGPRRGRELTRSAGGAAREGRVRSRCAQGGRPKFALAGGRGQPEPPLLLSGPGGEGGCSAPWRAYARLGVAPPTCSRRPGRGRADGEAGGRFAVCGFFRRGPGRLKFKCDPRRGRGRPEAAPLKLKSFSLGISRNFLFGNEVSLL
ncbi:Forkhead Box Protein O1, partial [Manis pentadactyla]